MAKFIEVTNLESGTKSLVNLDQVLEISTDYNGNTYFESSVIGTKGRTAGVITYRLTCKENFDEVKAKLLNCWG